MRNVFTRQLVVIPIAILLQASASTAFAQRPEEVLQGRWQLDAARSVKAGGEQSRQLLTLIKALTIELRKDGTAEVITNTADQPMTQSGTWKVLKTDGKAMDLEIATGSSNHKEMFKATLLEAGDYLQLTVDKNQPIKFVFVLARAKSIRR
jgi:hypothetical protein